MGAAVLPAAPVARGWAVGAAKPRMRSTKSDLRCYAVSPSRGLPLQPRSKKRRYRGVIVLGQERARAQPDVKRKTPRQHLSLSWNAVRRGSRAHCKAPLYSVFRMIRPEAFGDHA